MIVAYARSTVSNSFDLSRVVLISVKRSPERFEDMRRYKVAQTQTWSHPILLGNQLVIRDAGSVSL